MAFHISRQRVYPDRILSVDLTCGGKKKAGPDILPTKFDKEGGNYVSPVDAVNIALHVFEQWENYSRDEIKRICVVNASGKGERVYLDPHNKRDVEKLVRWGAETLKNMAKCTSCAKPLGNGTVFEIDDMPGKVFCSEVHLASVYRQLFGIEPPKVLSKKDKQGMMFP